MEETEEMDLAAPLVGVVMGSKSDYEVMSAAVDVLREFGVAYEARVVSAHRTPDLLFEYAAAAAKRGLRAIIAGAGGAAHLPGMLAAKTAVPVLGVPVPATALQGMDALLSIVQMPRGIPVATFGGDWARGSGECRAVCSGDAGCRWFRSWRCACGKAGGLAGGADGRGAGAGAAVSSETTGKDADRKDMAGVVAPGGLIGILGAGSWGA